MSSGTLGARGFEMALVWTKDRMLAGMMEDGAEEEWHLLPDPPDSEGCRACVLVAPAGTARLYRGILNCGEFADAETARAHADKLVKGE